MCFSCCSCESTNRIKYKSSCGIKTLLYKENIFCVFPHNRDNLHSLNQPIENSEGTTRSYDLV